MSNNNTPSKAEALEALGYISREYTGGEVRAVARLRAFILASAPASAPLPLLQRCLEALNIAQGACEYGVYHPTFKLWCALEDDLKDAIARECLPAAPVADERASFEAWWPTDPVARAHADNSRDLALIEHGWHARAALSGGSPEPVSGSEGEEEGGRVE